MLLWTFLILSGVVRGLADDTILIGVVDELVDILCSCLRIRKRLPYTAVSSAFLHALRARILSYLATGSYGDRISNSIN